jgi:hypothetical protein
MKDFGAATMKSVVDYTLGDAGEPCIAVGPCLSAERRQGSKTLVFLRLDLRPG